MTDEPLSELGLDTFLSRLSTRDPVPGGGSAAAIAGAMGAALVHMVVELTAGRAAETDEATLQEMAGAAAMWRSELVRLAETDAAAFAGVIAARRLPRETERDAEARRVQVRLATQEATRAPLEVARRSSQLLDLAERLAPIGHRNAISDVGVAGLLTVTAIRGAALNVRINLPSLEDADPLRSEAAEEIDRLLDGLEDRDRALQAIIQERLT